MRVVQGGNSDVEGRLFEELDEKACQAPVDKRLLPEKKEEAALLDQNTHIVTLKELEKMITIWQTYTIYSYNLEA